MALGNLSCNRKGLHDNLPNANIPNAKIPNAIIPNAKIPTVENTHLIIPGGEVNIEINYTVQDNR